MLGLVQMLVGAVELDQLGMIEKVRDHIRSIKKTPWKRQHYDFWITTEECEDTDEKIVSALRASDSRIGS